MLKFNLPIPSRFEERRPETFSSPLLSTAKEGIYFFSCYKLPIAKAGTFEPPMAKAGTFEPPTPKAGTFVGIFIEKPFGKEF